VSERKATAHIYTRNNVIYVYAFIDGKRRRYSVKKEATQANIEWAKAHWREIIDEKIKRRSKYPKSKSKDKRVKGATKHVTVRGRYIHVYAYMDGKRRRYGTGKLATEANLAWASKRYKEIIREKLKVKEVPKTLLKDITFAEYAKRSLEAGERKDTTIKNYRSSLKTSILPYFGKTLLKDITSLSVREWMRSLAKKDKSADTIKSARSVLSAILNDAFDDEIIDRNVVRSTRPPKLKRKKNRPLSLRKVKILLDTAKEDQFKDFLIVSIFTGVRTGEALGLEWRHVDFEKKIIRIEQSRSDGKITTPKTESSIRNIDMLPIVETALKRQYERTGKHKSGFVFLTTRGKPYRYITSMCDRWKALLAKCGFSYRKIYNTRHTFASIMLSEGEIPIWVSKTLGHESLAMTLKVYASYLPRENEKHAEFLDGFFD
jgi:integrase